MTAIEKASKVVRTTSKYIKERPEISELQRFEIGAKTTGMKAQLLLPTNWLFKWFAENCRMVDQVEDPIDLIRWYLIPFLAASLDTNIMGKRLTCRIFLDEIHFPK